jgi:hypothetical protein
VHRFEAGEPFDPEVCRANALQYSPERFRREFLELVERVCGLSSANDNVVVRMQPRAFAGPTDASGI